MLSYLRWQRLRTRTLSEVQDDFRNKEERGRRDLYPTGECVRMINAYADYCSARNQ